MNELCQWSEGLSPVSFSLYLVAVFLGTILLCFLVDRVILKHISAKYVFGFRIFRNT